MSVIARFARCDESYAPVFDQALGVVLQNSPDDLASQELATQLAQKSGIPLLIRADGAMALLQEEQLVTLDPEKGIIYQGSIAGDKELLPPVYKM